MNAADLARKLECSRQQITAWLKRGLPSSGSGAGREFDFDAVEAWLVAQGLREPTAAIATTLDEVAEYLGVSRRTAAEYRARGMPGEPGNYPLAAIEAWRKREVEQPGGINYQQELMRVRARRELLELQRFEGHLVEVELPERIMAQAISLMSVLLDQLPDRLAARLPESLGDDVREELRRLSRADVDEARHALAAALEELAAALTPPEAEA